MFGLLIGNKRHAWCLFAVMLGLYVLSFGVAWYAETRPNPVVDNIMPLMEGKEQRFGVMNSVLWGVSATAIDNGSVNSIDRKSTRLNSSHANISYAVFCL